MREPQMAILRGWLWWLVGARERCALCRRHDRNGRRARREFLHAGWVGVSSSAGSSAGGQGPGGGVGHPFAARRRHECYKEAYSGILIDG